MLFRQLDIREEESAYRKPREDQIPQETVNKAKEFYEQDDISRILPGKRDVVTVKTDKGKEKFQKRHLYMSLRETHSIFLEENPEVHIGLTKFSLLRPAHVKFSSQTLANVCTCIYHQNIILALDAMHCYDESFPNYSSSFPGSCIIDPNSEYCWYGRCTHSECGFEQRYPEPENIEREASWKKWEEVKGRIIKNAKTGQVGDLYHYLCEIVSPFLTHSFVKRKQAESYEIDKVHALSEDSTSIMLQVDFAENYTCLAQDEVQSAHWHQKQITLFTSVSWFQGQTQSAVVISDNLTHDKKRATGYA